MNFHLRFLLNLEVTYSIDMDPKKKKHVGWSLNGEKLGQLNLYFEYLHWFELKIDPSVPL